jgi:hypothetical protein
MDYPLNGPDILSALEQASSFDLWQLSLAIERTLKDSERNKLIKVQLRINQEAIYFDPRENKEIFATVMEIHRTHALVKNHRDQKLWEILFYMFQIDRQNTIRPKTQKWDRLHFKVADRVEFLDRSGQAQYGQVTKLNLKTAEVTLPTGERWRVSYPDLFQVLEAESEFLNPSNPKGVTADEPAGQDFSF